MQNVHYVAALDHNARFVHFFLSDSVDFPSAPEDMIGRQLGENIADEEEARRFRATFSECLYTGKPQECVLEDETGRQILCRFEKVLQKTDRTMRSDDEVVAIAVACELPDRIELSEREQQIVKLICQDLSNSEIAAQLHIKSSTIETHRQNIRHKLGVKGTSGIVLYAVRHGWVQ